MLGEHTWQDKNDPSRTQRKIEILATGAGMVDAEAHQLESTRAELSGMLAPLTIIHDLLALEKRKLRAKLTFLCDNESAVKSLQQILDRELIAKDLRENNTDLKCEIRHWISKSTEAKRVAVKWVKSHQDENEELQGMLTSEEILNVMADILADVPQNESPWGVRFRQERNKGQPIWNLLKTPVFEHSIPNNGLVIRNRNCVQVKPKSREMISAAAMPEVEDRFCRKNNWTVSTLEMIDFRNVEQITRSQSKEGKLALAYKIFHDKLNTNSEKNRIYPGSGAACTRCECNATEDREHLLKCSNLDSRILADETLVKLSDILKNDLDAEDDTHDEILTRVKARITSGLPLVVDRAKEIVGKIELRAKAQTKEREPDLLAAISSQDEIGWEHFLVGYQSKQWMELATARSIKSLKPCKAHLWGKIAKCLHLSVARAWEDRMRWTRGIDAQETDEFIKQTALHHIEKYKEILQEDKHKAEEIPSLTSSKGQINPQTISTVLAKLPCDPHRVPPSISLLETNPTLQGSSFENIKKLKNAGDLLAATKMITTAGREERKKRIQIFKKTTETSTSDKTTRRSLQKEYLKVEDERSEIIRRRLRADHDDIRRKVNANVTKINIKISESAANIYREELEETNKMRVALAAEEESRKKDEIKRQQQEQAMLIAKSKEDVYADSTPLRAPLRKRKRFKKTIPSDTNKYDTTR